MSDIKPVGKLTPYNPPTSNVKSVKPVGELTPVGELVPVGAIEQPRINDFGVITEKEDNIESTLDFIQKNSKRLMRDDEKDILRDMFKNPNATKEDISDAIVTLQGKKAKQIDNTITMPDYYMDINEKGVYKPIALTQGERAPKGKEMVSIWGTQKSANDDAWYTDVAKTAFNIIPGVVGGVVDVLQLGTELVAGRESEWLKQAQIGQEALKFKKDADIEKSIYNTEDINKFTDLFDSSRVNLSPEVIWGTALSAAGFMGEMLVPSSLIAKGAKGYKAGKAGLALIEEAGGISKIAQKASVFAGSFMTQIGDVMDSSSEAGLEGRVKALYDLTIGTLLASVDAKYDVAGKILTNKLAQDAKKEILSEVGKKVVKDKLGNVTKESLNEAAKEAMTAYTPIVSSFAKNYGKDVLDEVKDEVLQSFIEKAGQNVYDKLSPQEKANFGTDAFSAKSFGEYINSAASGLVGSIVPSLMSAKGKQQVDYKAQSNSAYDTVMQGEEAVKAFKTNITNAFQSGQINKEDYDNAILKVDAYDSYEKTTKDLTLDNDNKKKLFELSLQKENLKAAIKDAESKDTEGHSRLDKMNPAELGLHNAKVKQAKALQDEIDLIVTKSEVLQQPEVAEKVVEKVVKAEEKATEGAKVKEGVSSEIGAILGRQYKVKTPVGGEVAVPGKAAYEVPKKVLEETRKMKEIPVEEFNDPNFDVTVKQAKLAEALDEVPEKTTTGTLQIDNEFTDDKGRKVQTFNITLPNGKAARFASSMVRFPEENAAGGFRGNTYEENLTNKENPVGQKLGVTVRTLKDSGRKVIFVWNADEGPKFGKHIGMVKERLRGKSDYSETDIEEMADLRMINMGQNPNAPAPGIFTPKEPTKGGAPKAATPVKNKEVRDKLKGLGYSKPEIQAMEPQEANDIVKEQREKSKVKKQPLEEVEIKDKKAAAKANEAKRIVEKDKWKEGTDIVINKKGFYTEDELEKHERAVQLKLDDYFDEAEKKYGSFEKAKEEINKSGLKETTTHKKYWDLIEERDRLQRHNEKLLYDIVNNSLSGNKNISDDLKKSLIEYYFKMRPNQPAVYAFGSANLTGDNSISKLLSNESLPKLAKEIAKQRAEEMNLDFDALYSTVSGWGKEKQQNFLEENAKIAKEIQTEIFKNISENYLNDSFESFQKTSQVEKKIADYREQEQEQLKREIPNIDKYKVDGKIDEDLIKDPEDLKKYKEIYKKYDEKISPLLGKEPAKEKGKVVVKKAPKEVVVEKEESIAKRKALMESILGASKLIAAYNGLTKVQKRSKIGVDLYKKIQDRVKEIGYTTTISRGGTLQLIGEKGKRVYKTPVKRTEDQKAMDEERKDALSAEATSIRHAVILSIANGRQFDVPSLEKYFPESVLKNEMPSLLKNNKNGIKVSSYKTSYEERFGQFEIENLTEADATREAAEALGDYFIDGFREAAIQDAIDINFKTKNEGRSRSEVEALNEMQKEQDKEQKELEDILAQEDLQNEEYRRQAEEEEYKSDRTPDVRNNIIRAYKDKSVINLPASLLKDLMEFDRTKDFSINDKETGPENIKKLKDSIQKEGLKEPLEIAINSKGAIVLSEGNHRLQALIELGYTQIPVKVIGRASKDEYFTEVRQGKTIQLGLNLNKDFNIEPAKEEGYLQKAKVKPATLNKFEKSVDLFYKTKDADGASKKRSLAAERREFLEKNPTVKYIDDNMKYIYKQLEEQNIIERKGECP